MPTLAPHTPTGPHMPTLASHTPTGLRMPPLSHPPTGARPDGHYAAHRRRALAHQVRSLHVSRGKGPSGAASGATVRSMRACVKLCVWGCGVQRWGLGGALCAWLQRRCGACVHV
eukprot:364681-Chlamydomonas_euryale.AAC.20